MREDERQRKIKEAEKKIDASVDSVMDGSSTKKRESTKVEKIISDLIKNKILKPHEIRSLKNRIDYRTYFGFFYYIRKCHAKEEREVIIITKTFHKHDRKISFEEYGNKDKGRARLVNFNSKPDKKVIYNNIPRIMDLKSLKEHCLKISDLDKYAKQNSGIFVITGNYVYIYKRKTIKRLSKIVRRFEYSNKIFVHPEWKAEVVKIGEDRKSMLSLKSLVRDRFVIQLER